MRPLTLAGIVLVLLGGFILFRGVTYRSDRSVLKIGDVEAKVEEQRPVPAWVGGILVLGGIAMVAAGARQRRT